MAKITVQNTDISVVKYNEEDYISLEFKIIGRSPLDNEGKTYPLLHLQYGAN